MKKQHILPVMQGRFDVRGRPLNPSSDRLKRIATLTNRHRQIATLVTRGLTNRAIAQKLDLTEGTVKVHLHAIYERLDIHSRTKLAIALLSYTEPRHKGGHSGTSHERS
jgi:DNA-binding NarL/FixJ family response regulator